MIEDKENHWTLYANCRVENCEKEAKTKGMCQTHYCRDLKYGDPNHLQRLPWHTSPADRMLHVGWVETVRRLDTPCWEWAGDRHESGYGLMTNPYGSRYVHRTAYETWVGVIPEGHLVRHKCDNPPCMNPDHLETGTHSDNRRDMLERNRPEYPTGPDHPASKLSATDRAVVYDMYTRKPYTQKDLAKLFNVDESHISRVIRKERERRNAGGI